jgi:hypothetical protein
MHRMLLVVLLLLSMRCIASADRFAATEYECGQVAREELGLRCAVWRLPYPDGTVLLIWQDEGSPRDDAREKRRKYLVQVLIEKYAERGGSAADFRTTLDGKPRIRYCMKSKGAALINFCEAWKDADQPGPEWASLIAPIVAPGFDHTGPATATSR